MKTVLLAGATGLVGGHVFATLANNPALSRIVLLLTSASEAYSETVGRLRQFAGHCHAEIHCICGDTHRPRFGLSDGDWNKLGREIDLVFHCVESDWANQSLAAMRRAYVEPLRTWIELLERNDHLRFGHLSTAFVAGTRQGLFTECDLDCKQSFHNAWEQAQYEAEVLLRTSTVAERMTFFRPSLTVGDSRDGRAFAFTGFYDLLRRLRQKRLGFVCGDSCARLDIVPVDYVASAMVELSEDAGTSGNTFHLVAGWEKSICLRELLRLVARREARSVWVAPPFALRLISPWLRMAAWSGALNHPAAFDDFYSKLHLRDLRCSRVESYLCRAIEFAEAHNWQMAPPQVPPYLLWSQVRNGGIVNSQG